MDNTSTCRKQENRLKFQVCPVCQTNPCKCRSVDTQNKNKMTHKTRCKTKYDKGKTKQTKKGKTKSKCKDIGKKYDCYVTACSRKQSTIRCNTPVRAETNNTDLSFQDMIWILLTPRTINCLQQLLQDKYGLTLDEATQYIDQKQIYVLESLRKLAGCSKMQSAQILLIKNIVKQKYRNPQAIQRGIIDILNKQIGSQFKAKNDDRLIGDVFKDDETSEMSEDKNEELHELLHTVSGINLLEKFIGDIQHESKRMRLCSEYCHKIQSCKPSNDQYAPWKFSLKGTFNGKNKNCEDKFVNKDDLCCKHILSPNCQPICCESHCTPRLTNCVPLCNPDTNCMDLRSYICQQTCQNNSSKLDNYCKCIELLKKILDNQNIQSNSSGESPESYNIALEMYKLMSNILERTVNKMIINKSIEGKVETAENKTLRKETNILEENEDELCRKINYCCKTIVRSCSKPENAIVKCCEPQLQIVKDKTTEVSSSLLEVKEIQTLAKQIRNITAQTELAKKNTFVQTEPGPLDESEYFIQTNAGKSESPQNVGVNEANNIALNIVENLIEATHSVDSETSGVDITEFILYEVDQNSKVYLSKESIQNKYFQFSLSSSLFKIDFDKIFQKQTFPNKEHNKSNISTSTRDDFQENICQKILSNEYFDANCIDLKIKVHDQVEKTRTSMYIYNKKSIRDEHSKYSDCYQSASPCDEPIIINLDYNKDKLAKKILDSDISDDNDTFSDASSNTCNDSIYIDATDKLYQKSDDNNKLSFRHHGKRLSGSSDTFQSVLGLPDCGIPSHDHISDFNLSEFS